MLYSLFIMILNNGYSIMVPWYPLWGGGGALKKNRNLKIF